MINTKERMSYGEGAAIREPQTGKPRMDLFPPEAMLRLGMWYGEGGEKYGDRNWEKGMLFSHYVGAILRHTYKYMANDRTEDHLAAIAWNALAMMHHEERGEDAEWNDYKSPGAL